MSNGASLISQNMHQSVVSLRLRHSDGAVSVLGHVTAFCWRAGRLTVRFADAPPEMTFVRVQAVEHIPDGEGWLDAATHQPDPPGV